MAKRKTQSEIDKEKRHEDLQNMVQQSIKRKMSMADFQKNWNTKNKQKITEMVKLGDVILIRFGNTTVHCTTDKLYL